MIVLISSVHAIDAQHMEVRMKIQSRTEALDEGHRTTLRLPLGAEVTGALNQERKDRLVKTPRTAVISDVS
jgi:hypothetical protein